MYHFSICPPKESAPTYGIANLELKDGCFGLPLSQLSGKRLELIRNKLIADRKRIVLYTLSMPLSEYESYLSAFRAAHLLRIEAVKLCLCTLREADGNTFRQLSRILELAEDSGIRVLWEPKAEYDFFTPESYKAVRTDWTGLIFNPAEFAKQRKKPFLDVLYKSKWKHDIAMIRINDWANEGSSPVLPGQGNAELKECVSALLAQNFDGYFSLIPYLGELTQEDVLNQFTLLLMEM